MSMMIEIGTPSSQSSIPRPMSASFLIPRYRGLVNGQRSVSFRQITPRKIYYAVNQIQFPPRTKYRPPRARRPV